MFLLVPSSGASRERTLSAGGQAWVLESFDDAATLPAYSCISYAWGEGRSGHPLVPGEQISDRASRVLDAAARLSTTKALWMDAFCVPVDEAARQATLRQLGNIYAGASEVLVVLSDSARPLFDECEAGGRLSLDRLRLLEQEPWVSRFWTYQELAIAKELRFVTETGSTFALSGPQLLSKVGEPLAHASPAEVAALRATDNFNDVLASWIYGGGQPFAYQIMAGLAQRGAERPADRFNAVLGALGSNSHLSPAADLDEASEHFMATCEAKEDLSFVYASSARSTRPGRSWRPQAGELLPVMAWHTFGKGQRGKVLETHAALDDMRVALQGQPAHDVRDFIEQWLSQVTRRHGDPLAVATATALGAMGAALLGPPLQLEAGLFFPARTRVPDDAHLVLVASEVRWVHGAPALLVKQLVGGRYRCDDVGIFVGPPRPGTSVELE